MAGDDRSEAATPRRLERARLDGHFAISREIPALAGLGMGMLVLSLMASVFGRELIVRLEPFLAFSRGSEAGSALLAASVAVGTLAGPVVLGVLTAAVASSAMQTGLGFSPNRIRPDFGRLNPARGLSRVLGPAGLLEAAKSSVKVGTLGLSVFYVLSHDFAGFSRAVLWQPSQLAFRSYHAVLRVAAATLFIQAVIAVADAWWVRYRHTRQFRMSKEEVRQEARDADGNPHVKQRLRLLRLSRARKRMLASVPGATVVVTNPTHYAIALAYDRIKGGAPRVVAKGMDDVAARIRKVAEDSKVPMVVNPPLARALYMIELDDEIPSEHFKVVAEIIAYVWRLRARVVVS